MLFYLVLPLFIGAFGVLQNTVNKKIAETLGLPLALVVNNIILLALSLGFLLLARMLPQESLPELFRQKAGIGAAGWKIFLPGLFGFFIISMAPWAIEKAGATRVFIGIIVAQIVASLLWDYFAEAVPVSATRLAGAALALAGALLAVR